MHVVSIHGLGGTAFSHYPLITFLSFYFSNITFESYSWDSKNLQYYDAVEDLEDYLNNFTQDLILVGHSLGGKLAMSVDNPKVKGVVTISTPHDGCEMAKILQSLIGPDFAKYFLGEMHDILAYHITPKYTPKVVSITSSWTPWTPFDGRVCLSEMVHPLSDKVLHLDYSEHIVQLYDPRMWYKVAEGIEYIL